MFNLCVKTEALFVVRACFVPESLSPELLGVPAVSQPSPRGPHAEVPYRGALFQTLPLSRPQLASVLRAGGSAPVVHI